jgi:urocanate hydratase
MSDTPQADRGQLVVADGSSQTAERIRCALAVDARSGLPAHDEGATRPPEDGSEYQRRTRVGR